MAKDKSIEICKKIITVVGLLLLGSGSILDNKALIVAGTILSIIAALLILVLK